MNRAVMILAKRLPLLALTSTAGAPQPKQLFSWVRRMPLQDRHRVIHRLNRGNVSPSIAQTYQCSGVFCVGKAVGLCLTLPLMLMRLELQLQCQLKLPGGTGIARREARTVGYHTNRSVSGQRIGPVQRRLSEIRSI